jgi:intracellular septation protein
LKLLFDLVAVVLFFAAYKIGAAYPEATAHLVGSALEGLVPGKPVPAQQAPFLLATAVAVVTSLLQVAFRLVRRQKVEPMLWVVLAVVVLFGGLTIWFQDEVFFKWKPTIVYWLFAAILLSGRLLGRKNLLQSVLGEQIDVPPPIWERFLWAWIVFFVAIGVVNLVVAFSVPTDAWVNFKLFGLFGITLVFILATVFWLARHMKEAPDA